MAFLFSTYFIFAVGTATAQHASIPFEAPETVALFAKAKQIKGEGVVDGNDCSGAMKAAMEDAQTKATKHGTGAILRIISDKKGWTPAESVTCTFTGKPDNPKTTKATFWAIAVAPGSPETVFPRLPTSEALDVLQQLAESPTRKASGAGRFGGIQIYNEQGTPYVDQGKIAPDGKLNTIQLNRNARAAHAFQNKIIPWVNSWVPSYRDLPHIQGAAVNVLIKSENFVTNKEKRKETFRFVIPIEIAKKFVAGSVSEGELLNGSSLYYAEKPVDRPTQKIKLDTTSGAW